MNKQNFGKSSSCLVDKYIGTDFDKVITVSDNMDHVETVSTNIDDVKLTSQNMGDINTIVASLPTYQLSQIVTLSVDQTIVPFTKIVPIGSEFIVTGQAIDDGHLIINEDYEVFEGTKIKLFRSYPEGTQLKGFQVVHREAEITNVIFKNGDPVIVHPIPTNTAVSTYTFPFEAWWVADIYVNGKYLDPLKYELNCDTFTLTFNPVIPIGSELIAQVGGSAASINSWIAKLEQIKTDTGVFKDEAEQAMTNAQAAQHDTSLKLQEVTRLHGEVQQNANSADASMQQAAQYASTAFNSKELAKVSETNSKASELLSERWATDTGLVDGVSFSSKKYSEVSRDSAELSQRWSQEVTNPIDGIGYGSKYYAVNAASSATDANQSKVDAVIAKDKAIEAQLGAEEAQGICENLVTVVELPACSMTQAEFFAIAEQRKRVTNGSGTYRVGETGLFEPINEGLNGSTTVSNTMTLGNNTIQLVNGIAHYTGGDFLLPDAPDGTKTYDSETGEVVIHESVELAFASETETNKVITTRKDLVFLETGHEDISNIFFHPNGDVQFKDNSWNGISLVQDLTTKGFGKKWLDMPTSERIKAIQDPKNNIYFNAETKKYIQVKFIKQVIEGNSDLFTLGSYLSNRGYIKNSDDVTRWSHPTGKEVIGICLVQRLNQGAYHPVWNSEGCRKFRNPTVSNAFWYDYDLKNKVNSTKKCFTNPTIIGEAGYHELSGFITSSYGTGRPDQYKFYDAIYAGQVEDLRLNANKQDYNRLLEEGIRKAVAGETRGKGKVPFLTSEGRITSQDNPAVTGTYIADATGELIALDAGVVVWITYPDGSLNVRTVIRTNSGKVIILNDIIDRKKGATVWFHKWLTPEYDSLPWVDITGSPENIAATFPNGVVGQWIPNIPNNTVKHFALNRKSLQTSVTCVESTDNGTTWIEVNRDLLTATNDFVHTKPANEVSLISYSSLSNFTEANNNLAIEGEVGKVITTNYYEPHHGNRLVPSLLSKIAVSSTTWGINNKILAKMPMVNISMDFRFNVIPPIEGQLHEPMILDAPANNSPTVKTLYTLIEKHGLLYMQYHGSELKYKHRQVETITITTFTGNIGKIYYIHPVTNSRIGGKFIQVVPPQTSVSINIDYLLCLPDDTIVSAFSNEVVPYLKVWDGTGWGDDSTIPIVDGESIRQNLNGDVVKTFCHHELIPIGIADTSSTSQRLTKDIL